MPNSQNRNNNNSKSGKGQPNDRPSTQDSQKPNPERSDIKHNTDEAEGHNGHTSRSSNEGRKEASGGSAED